MTLWGLIGSGLRYSWRRHVGVLFGMAIASAVLVGALAVGDSVRASLRQAALDRVGQVSAVVDAGDRFFAADLAGRVGTDVAAAMRLRGIANTPDRTARAGNVQVLGVDSGFFALSRSGDRRDPPGPGEVFLSERLARRLSASEGDEVVLRVEKPSALPRGTALADEEDTTVGLRVRVAGVLPDKDGGRFALHSQGTPPWNAVVSREWLSERVSRPGRANLLLIGQDDGSGVADWQARVEGAVTLDDLQLHVAERKDVAELSSPRIFLDSAVESAARSLELPSIYALTYFVNELRAGERVTPYSTVTALSGAGDLGRLDPSGVVPRDLGEDEIVINDWLAADLAVAPGDALALRYFVLAPDLSLVERAQDFTVRSVAPMSGVAADPEWMPDFPGLKDSRDCQDWEPGIPVDLTRIRDRDEAYWDEHRGTPKAFLSLASGQRRFGSRFGSLTSIRVPAAVAGRFAAELRRALDVRALGFTVEDVRGPALSSATSATDFGGLFLGLSFFLIAAALMLISLLFAFGVEQRRPEIGALRAVGFAASRVRWLLLSEAACVGLVGAALGVVLGVGYTKLLLRGLSTLWSDAVASTAIRFAVGPASLIGGALVALTLGLIAVWVAARREIRRPIADLLRGREPDAGGFGAHRRRWIARSMAIGGAVAAVALMTLVKPASAAAASGVFFSAGSLLLVAAIAGCHLLLARVRDRGWVDHPRLPALAWSNASRRVSRSLTAVALLASGVFLVMAVGVNRLAPPSDPGDPSSGTGGFTLLATSTVPVHQNLETERGRDVYGLLPDEMASVEIVPMLEREGDDASCLNLAQTSRPRLLGVDPAQLAARGSFSFASTIEETEDPWLLLRRDDPAGAVPAIGDAASVTWAIKKKVGDTIEYVDEGGHEFVVRIVGTVENSILQGMLVIDQDAFRQRFPEDSGYRTFLIDSSPSRAAEVSSRLTQALSDVGLEVGSTADRLAELNAVQNTYLAIFQVLGGLGVLLGTFGLGLVVLRNVLERRAEMAVLAAVGFRRAELRRLVLIEHGALLVLGLGAGFVAASAAVIPGGRDAWHGAPLLLLALIVVTGVVSVVASVRAALSGALVDALREV